MPQYKETFSGFSVDNQEKAKQFYGETLGLKVEDGKMGLILHHVDNGTVFIYPKPNHQPATYTTLNLVVEGIDAAVDELSGKGVAFERYEGMHQDEKGVARGKAAGHGPDIAWFKDPAGNIIALIEH